MHGGAWTDARVLSRSDDDLFDFLRPDPGIQRGYYALARTIADAAFDSRAVSRFLGRSVGDDVRTANEARRARRLQAPCVTCGARPSFCRGMCRRCYDRSWRASHRSSGAS